MLALRRPRRFAFNEFGRTRYPMRIEVDIDISLVTTARGRTAERTDRASRTET